MARNLAKLTKLSKGDCVHPGQLYYVHWRNTIDESRNIIRQYGIIPEIKSKDELKNIPKEKSEYIKNIVKSLLSAPNVKKKISYSNSLLIIELSKVLH